MGSFSWIDWVVVVAGVIIAALIAVMQVRLQRNKATQHFKTGTHPGMAPEDAPHGKAAEEKQGLLPRDAHEPDAAGKAGREICGSIEKDGES
jgi:hypothetical protein